MKKYILLPFILCFSLWCNGQGITFLENPHWEEVLQAAKQQNKMIFVDCYTVWCGPCQGMNKYIFPKKEMGDFYNPRFVCVKYDMEKPNGIAFRKLYPKEVSAYPTMLFINPADGKITHKIVGAKPVEQMIQEARKSIEGEGLTALQGRYDSGERDFEFMKTYWNTLSMANKKAIAVKQMDEYLRTHDSLPALMQPEKWKFYSNYITDLHTGFVQYIFQNYYRFMRLDFVDKAKLNDNLEKVTALSIGELIEIKLNDKTGKYLLPNNPETEKLIEKSLKVLEKHKGIESHRAKYAIYKLLAAKEWQKAYHHINAACDFGFVYADHRRIISFAYIAGECNNKTLQKTLLADLRCIQAQGEKWIQFYNVYNFIAYAAETLGLKKEATEAQQKYEQITAEREKLMGKSSPRKKSE